MKLVEIVGNAPGWRAVARDVDRAAANAVVPGDAESVRWRAARDALIGP